jgi:hypothetical protein
MFHGSSKGNAVFTFFAVSARRKRSWFTEKYPIRVQNEPSDGFSVAKSLIISGMTTKEKLLANKVKLGGRIAELDRVIHEIAVSGTASASLSAGSGSKSYTRLNLPDLQRLRSQYAERFGAICRALKAGSSPAGKRTVQIVRY